MSYIADLAEGIAAININYHRIEQAIENEPRGGDIQRQLAARILLDLWPLLEKLDLRSPLTSRFGTTAKSVVEFQREYKCLEGL